MPGLRERKAKQTRRRITEAASALMAERHPEAITMEEIASAAEDSPTTVYNYFGSKTALLLSVVSNSTDTTFDDHPERSWTRPNSSAEAVGLVLAEFIDPMVAMGSSLVRAVLQSPPSDDTRSIESEFLQRLTAYLERLQSDGLFAEAVSPADGARLLFAIVLANLVLQMGAERHATGSVPDRVRSQVQAVFCGLSRNE